MPDAAITTDIIVGFPGETEEDFQATLDVVRAARFAGAFTFQYSKRPGTPAATLDEQVPKEVVQERYERLVALANDIAWAENRALEGRTVELMVAEGEGRKDAATHRLSGRARDNRLVHFTPVAVDGRAGRRAPRRHGRGRGHLRRPAPPRRRRPGAARCVVPAPATLGGAHAPPPAGRGRWGSRRSASPPRSRPRPAAHAERLGGPAVTRSTAGPPDPVVHRFAIVGVG